MCGESSAGCLFPDGGSAYCACALQSAARVRNHAPLQRPVVQPRNGRRINHGPTAGFSPDNSSIGMYKGDNNTSVVSLFSLRQTEYSQGVMKLSSSGGRYDS
jgi:hypothetical protein